MDRGRGRGEVVGREEKKSDREFNTVIEKENERKREEETREREKLSCHRRGYEREDHVYLIMSNSVIIKEHLNS